jgi:hypothetical protein
VAPFLAESISAPDANEALSFQLALTLAGQSSRPPRALPESRHASDLPHIPRLQQTGLLAQFVDLCCFGSIAGGRLKPSNRQGRRQSRCCRLRRKRTAGECWST